MTRILLIVVLFFLTTCSLKRDNKFTDPILVKIHDLKDHRISDSLATFLNSPEVIYRREAALAFGSVQDSTISMALGNILLEDPDSEARKNAAFALGQTGGFQAVNGLIPALQDVDRTVIREVLEALGKTLEKKDLNILHEFQTTDTLLQEGLAWAFYRLAIRSKADSIITKKAAGYLTPEKSFQTRFGAASYFGRSRKVDGKDFDEKLIQAALHDIRPEVRMMAVSGFRHLPMEIVIDNIPAVFNSEMDYRVKVNAVRICQNFNLPEIQDLVIQSLNDKDEMVQVAASEVIRNRADQYSIRKIENESAKAKAWRVKANLYAALLKVNPKEELVDEIINQYSSSSVYLKSAWLSAMGESKAPGSRKAFQFLSEEMNKNDQEKVILTSAASAMTSLNRKKQPNISKDEFLTLYKNVIAHEDPAVIGIVASALMDTSLHYKEAIKDLTFLYDAKAKLVLPKDIESYQPLERAIAYFEGKSVPDSKNEFNHPIHWEKVKTIPKDQRVKIKTTQGTIVIRLFVDEAPGSVLNFVELTEKKYFDGKFFHRVVPNFVIQAGCNRGDGYGSEDYSIRSEFSLRRYTTGSLGMASAGKDTEGTQWFITHTLTPHLDGGYTIFAEVVQGMEVVHKTEVGDQILEVRLQ